MRLFPHEVADVQPVLDMLETQNPKEYEVCYHSIIAVIVRTESRLLKHFPSLGITVSITTYIIMNELLYVATHFIEGRDIFSCGVSLY